VCWARIGIGSVVSHDGQLATPETRARLALTLPGVGLLTSSASAQTITLDPNSPTDQGNGNWVATGTWSMPADTATVKYTVSGIEVQYQPPFSLGRYVVTAGDKSVTPWRWTRSDNPGGGIYNLPFRLKWVKRTCDSQGNLINTENQYEEVVGSVTVV
jgi:hypothetical protein